MEKLEIKLISGGGFTIDVTEYEHNELMRNKDLKWVTFPYEGKKISIPFHNIEYIVYK